jgi:hypothetical protein
LADGQRQYRDPQRLTQWLGLLVIACIIVWLLLGLNAVTQMYVISVISQGGLPSTTVMMIASEANALRRSVVDVVCTVVVFSTVISWLVWIHRTCANTHALGAHGLRFTPGWAVIWHGVPIAQMWMPYRVVSEVWRASKNPARWQQEIAHRKLLWWWLIWLIWSVVGSIHVEGSQPGYGALMLSEQLTLAVSLLGLAGCALALTIVKEIGGFQAKAADRSLSAVFA